MRVAATNQLAALLDAHWPGAKAIFADVESPIAWSSCTRYPTPAAAAPPRREADGRVLRQARLLRPTHPPPSCSPGCAPPPPAPPTSRLTDAVRDAVLALVGVLTALERRGQGPRPIGRRPPRGAPGRRRSSRRCQGRVRSTPPRCSPSGAMSAQAYDRPDSIAALAGVTPVTKRVRQTPRRALPLGLQQTLPQGDHHLRRQQPPRQPLGREDLQRRPRQPATTTPTPSASSPAPGSASSGAAGTTASPTTPPDTAPPPHSPSNQRTDRRMRLTQGVSCAGSTVLEKLLQEVRPENRVAVKAEIMRLDATIAAGFSVRSIATGLASPTVKVGEARIV